MKKITDFMKKHPVALIAGVLAIIGLIVVIVVGVNSKKRDNALADADNRIEKKFDGKVDTLSNAIRGVVDYVDLKTKNAEDASKAFAKSYADSVAAGLYDDFDFRDRELKARVDSLEKAVSDLKKKKNSSGASVGSGYGSGKVPKHDHPQYADTSYVNKLADKTTPTTPAKDCNCKKKKKRRSSSSNNYSFGNLYGAGGY